MVKRITDKTTISINKNTKENLSTICRKTQTYDELILELIKLWREKIE